MPVDQKLIHSREFTNIEDQTLDLWNELQDKGLHERARSLLDAGLMFEHYTSLLDHDPAQRSLGEIAQQAQLAFTLQDETRKAIQELADHPTPPAAALPPDYERALAEIASLRAEMRVVQSTLERITRAN